MNVIVLSFPTHVQLFDTTSWQPSHPLLDHELFSYGFYASKYARQDLSVMREGVGQLRAIRPSHEVIGKWKCLKYVKLGDQVEVNSNPSKYHVLQQCFPLFQP